MQRTELTGLTAVWCIKRVEINTKVQNKTPIAQCVVLYDYWNVASTLQCYVAGEEGSAFGLTDKSSERDVPNNVNTTVGLTGLKIAYHNSKNCKGQG